MVPGAGLEPARPEGQGILSPMRLPISPPGRWDLRVLKWRRGSESNRRTRSCSPLHNHSATAPGKPGIWLLLSGGVRDLENGAGNEIRTRDPNLGKVVLYQLSYSRSSFRGVASSTAAYSTDYASRVNTFFSSFCFYC